jgi:hypothetical protein
VGGVCAKLKYTFTTALLGLQTRNAHRFCQIENIS